MELDCLLTTHHKNELTIPSSTTISRNFTILGCFNAESKRISRVDDLGIPTSVYAIYYSQNL